MQINKIILFFILFVTVSLKINAQESTMEFTGEITNSSGIKVSYTTGAFINQTVGTMMNAYLGKHPEGNPLNGGNDYKDITVSPATYITKVTVAWGYNILGFKLQFLKNNIIVKEITNFNASGNITSPTDFAVNKVVDVIRYLDADGSIGGAFELSHITFNPSLPVELNSFTASGKGGSILLNWSTATEINNYGFEIERASFGTSSGQEGSIWEKIGFVQGYGNSNSPKEYTFTDTNPIKGNIQYRLKQIDNDGGYKYYSQIAEVNYGITDVKGKQIPTEFGLSQNYPNPFNPSTIINYQIPVSGHVELKIYSMLGNEIATLVDGEKPAGYHKVEFNSSKYSLSDGVYFYRLKSDQFTSTKKLILLK